MFRLQTLTLLALICIVSAATDDCKPDGKYCQNHWECCSNTCLSFLYKCAVIPTGTVVQSAPARPALGSPGVQGIAGPPGPLAISAQSRPAVFAPPVIPTVNPDTLTLNELLEMIFPGFNAIDPRLGEEEKKTPEVPKDKNENENTTNSDDIIPSSIVNKDEPMCQEIGSKCLYNENCCTKRCHGYLHKCVT